MASKDQVVKEKIEHSGLFDFASFYSFAHSWFKENGYGVSEGKYSEKVAGNKREIGIEWKATKKISDYFKADIGAKFDVSDLVDVEVEVNGDRQKMNRGKISIDLKGTLIKDPKGKWESSPFSKFMRGLYDKFVVSSKTDEAKSLVEDDVKGFKEDIKALLEMVGRRKKE